MRNYGISKKCIDVSRARHDVFGTFTYLALFLIMVNALIRDYGCETSLASFGNNNTVCAL